MLSSTFRHLRHFWLLLPVGGASGRCDRLMYWLMARTFLCHVGALWVMCENAGCSLSAVLSCSFRMNRQQAVDFFESWDGISCFSKCVARLWRWSSAESPGSSVVSVIPQKVNSLFSAAESSKIFHRRQQFTWHHLRVGVKPGWSLLKIRMPNHTLLNNFLFSCFSNECWACRLKPSGRICFICNRIQV